MTVRQIYDAALIEINKVQAPSFLLEDFNYWINKAIYQYVNKRYAAYDVNQQASDDLRVLKATAIIPIDSTATAQPYSGVYEAVLPSDYLHILSCVCNFRAKGQFKCYNADTYVQFPATRLTADTWPQIINNFYMRPTHKRPYFYIHNVNTSIDNPTNPYVAATNKGTDITSISFENDSVTVTGGLPRQITIGGTDISNIEKVAQVRYGNASPVRMEIRYGKDDAYFALETVYVDYLKTPQVVILTQEQLDLIDDTSQILEFQDYVCHEIINELVTIIMENASDPRLSTHIPVTQSIANPAQQQEKSK